MTCTKSTIRFWFC